MRIVRLVIAALLIMMVPSIAAAQNEDVIVRADPARIEIERILVADNLDTGMLGPRAVADTIAGIERGRAPDDFWSAYQAHVQAWQQLANAEDRARIARDDPTSLQDWAADVARAGLQIETTFDEVERIARLYGARLPVPPAVLRSTV